MTSFEIIQIAYFVTYILILLVTIYYIYHSPIKAVKIGRQLNEEQNKYDTKLQLFLTLFSHRGSPIHYEFVNGLNKIDLVFQDTPAVLTAWRRYYEALDTENSPNVIERRTLLRVELLSAMAVSLGYNSLQQTDIQRHYIPVGHQDFLQNDSALRESALRFFEAGTIVYKEMLARTPDYVPEGTTGMEQKEKEQKN